MESDRGGRDLGRERLPDVARPPAAGLSLDDHAVVSVGAAQHDALRALVEEARLPVALWRVQFGVVHLFARGGPGLDQGQSVVAVQAAVGHHQFGRLSGLHRDDGTAVAESSGPVFTAGRS